MSSAINEHDDAPATRIIELLNEYGEAKFGDEWWPGSPWQWIGRTKGDEFCRLMGAETCDEALDDKTLASLHE
jgi:hypothetical protein